MNDARPHPLPRPRGAIVDRSILGARRSLAYESALRDLGLEVLACERIIGPLDEQGPYGLGSSAIPADWMVVSTPERALAQALRRIGGMLEWIHAPRALLALMTEPACVRTWQEARSILEAQGQYLSNESDACPWILQEQRASVKVSTFGPPLAPARWRPSTPVLVRPWQSFVAEARIYVIDGVFAGRGSLQIKARHAHEYTRASLLDALERAVMNVVGHVLAAMLEPDRASSATFAVDVGLDEWHRPCLLGVRDPLGLNPFIDRLGAAETTSPDEPGPSDPGDPPDLYARALLARWESLHACVPA